jgi:hypothetical protein
MRLPEISAHVTLGACRAAKVQPDQPCSWRALTVERLEHGEAAMMNDDISLELDAKQRTPILEKDHPQSTCWTVDPVAPGPCNWTELRSSSGKRSGKLFGTKGAAVSNGRFHQQPIDECPRVMARR